MSLFHGVATLYEIARVVLPTVAESAVGGVTRADADRRTAQFARGIVGHLDVKLDVIGRDRVPADRAYIYMSNHQSHMDIPVLFTTIPSPTVRMVAKTELFRIPLWGRALRSADFIEIDRSNRESAIASLKRAGELIDSGVSVWIAPEGSRSRTGEIGPMKKGGFHLALEANAPIVPIAISGTARILPPGKLQLNPGIAVRVVFGAPIDVTNRTVADLSQEIQTFFETNVNQQMSQP